MVRKNTRRVKIVWWQTVDIIRLPTFLVWRECLCGAVQLGYSCWRVVEFDDRTLYKVVFDRQT